MISIVRFSSQKEQVIRLLIELQEHLVSADNENVQVLLKDYGEKYYHHVMNLLEENEGVAFLALEGKDIVGMVAGYIEPKDEEDTITTRCPKRGVVSELIVSEPFRERSIGKSLIDTIETYFLEKECEFVAVDVFAPNVDAQKFYNSLGYSPRNIEFYKRIR